MTTVKTKFKETEIGPIPEEWDSLPIYKLPIKIGDGNYSSKYPKMGEILNAGIPFISAKNIKNGRIVPDGLRFISPELHMKLSKGHIACGDVLIITRADVGRVGFVTADYENTNINAQLVYLRADNQKINNYFLYYLLSSKKYFDLFKSFSSGSAQSQLPIKAIKEIPIIFPPYNKQKQIAEILSSLDDKIELNNLINANLEAMASALFKKWFVDIGNELPKGWRVTTLGAFVPIKTGKKDANVATTDGQYPFFTCSQDILKTNIYSFDASALLLAGNGDFSVKWYEGKFEAYQRTYVLIPYKKELLGFLYYLIRYFLDDITSGHRGSVIRFITKGMIEDFRITVPNDEALEKMAKIFYEINQLIDFYKRETENLSKTRDLLLPQLMNGRIKVKHNY